MQSILGGDIYGWTYKDNHEAVIGEITGWDDHDFLLIDNRWLVDFWVFFQFPSGKAGHGVYDLNDKNDAEEVRRFYGPRSNWKKAKACSLYDPWGSNPVTPSSK